MKTRVEPSILIATGNRGKVRELTELLRPVPALFKCLADFPGVHEVEETGSTFHENAGLKASGYARQTGLWSIADDSGLEIKALNGAPGVLSARYGGESAGFPEKMKLVLAAMEKAADRGREARFVCSMVLADNDGRWVAEAEGECVGKIAYRPKGGEGFGYDPIFIPDGFDKTFGELSDQTKHKISHRARAAEKIIPYLLDFTGAST